MKYCLILVSLFMFLQVNGQQEKTHQKDHKSLIGYATYYAKKFEGRKTTSGKKYKAAKLTAAHRTLPFGTVVTVKNLTNGKSVDVVVNDRGPFTRKYIIDVSEGAAKILGIYGKGHSKVEITYGNTGV